MTRTINFVEEDSLVNQGLLLNASIPLSISRAGERTTMTTGLVDKRNICVYEPEEKFLWGEYYKPVDVSSERHRRIKSLITKPRVILKVPENVDHIQAGHIFTANVDGKKDEFSIRSSVVPRFAKQDRCHVRYLEMSGECSRLFIGASVGETIKLPNGKKAKILKIELPREKDGLHKA